MALGDTHQVQMDPLGRIPGRLSPTTTLGLLGQNIEINESQFQIPGIFSLKFQPCLTLGIVLALVGLIVWPSLPHLPQIELSLTQGLEFLRQTRLSLRVTRQTTHQKRLESKSYCKAKYLGSRSTTYSQLSLEKILNYLCYAYKDYKLYRYKVRKIKVTYLKMINFFSIILI